MIVNNEFMGKLKDFGLNSYEVKLWVALLSRGVSTAGELSDIANVPRSRTYDVLESLEKKGFIIMKIGKPIKYLAIEPSRVIDVIKKNIHTEAISKTKMIDKIKETELLRELQLLHTNGVEHIDSTDLSGAVRGKQNLFSHIESTISTAEKSVVIMTTETGLIEKATALKPIFEKLKKRGVSVRIAATLTSANEQAVKDLSQYCQIRHTPKPARFILVDGQQIMFMLLDDTQVHPQYDVGIWVNTPFFTQALENLFELAWKEMTPLKEIKSK